MKLLALAAVATATLLSIVPAADAQRTRGDTTGFSTPAGVGRQAGDIRTNVDRDRLANELSGNFEVRDRRDRLLNPGQVMNAAKAAVTTNGLSCNVTEAALRGVTQDNNDLWEVACQSGPGYMITSPGKSAPFDCTVLASQAAQAKADGVEVPAIAQCILKANQTTTATYAGYATAAGVPCTVDAGLPLGPNAYEIGCANADGYVIERKDTAWTKAPCWRMAASTDGSCKLSTLAESNAAWKDILAGTDAASCGVEKTRQVGVDSQKLVIYEVKCAGNTGYLARVNATAKAEKLHACSDPATAGIGGGCQLTKP